MKLQLKKSKWGAGVALFFLLLAWFADQPGEAGMGFYFLTLPWNMLINEKLTLNATSMGQAGLLSVLLWCCVFANAVLVYLLFGGLRLKKHK